MKGKKESRELSLYYKGLIMGLLLGVLGNLFVSYFMKILDFLELPLWGWAVATALGFVGILILVWLMYEEVKTLSGNKKGIES